MSHRHYTIFGVRMYPSSGSATNDGAKVKSDLQNNRET